MASSEVHKQINPKKIRWGSYSTGKNKGMDIFQDKIKMRWLPEVLSSHLQCMEQSLDCQAKKCSCTLSICDRPIKTILEKSILKTGSWLTQISSNFEPQMLSNHNLIIATCMHWLVPWVRISEFIQTVVFVPISFSFFVNLSNACWDHRGIMRVFFPSWGSEKNVWIFVTSDKQAIILNQVQFTSKK